MNNTIVSGYGYLIDASDKDANIRAILDPEGRLAGYYVSREGKIYSSKSPRKEKSARMVELKSYVVKGGNAVEMRICGKRIVRKVDAIVATAFVPNPSRSRSVEHINHLPFDDRAENLEWVIPERARPTARQQKDARQRLLVACAIRNGVEFSTPKSRMIAELYSAGLSRDNIADSVGVSTAYIGKIVKRLVETMVSTTPTKVVGLK